MKTCAEILFAIKYNNLSEARESDGNSSVFERRTSYARLGEKEEDVRHIYHLAEILGGIYAGRVLTSRL